MEYRTLGESALQVSAICMGTMTFGEQNDEAQAHALLDRAWEAGINFYDTAEMYPVPARAETYGATERIVGTWLKRKPRRSRRVRRA
jgi:aryl-alcohol dehydrogenase-like predicted oxidoreductase